MIWFSWVLWNINHCRLFNAKSSLYIYIKYIWFGLVGFYGISTFVGYLFYAKFSLHIQGSLNKFPDFFVWALLLIVHTWNSSPLRSNLLWLQCIFLYRSNNFFKVPWKSSCVSVSMTFVTASFISSIVS